MIVDDSDLEELEMYLDRFREFDSAPDWEAAPSEESSVEFFGEHPHLLLPLGFDESVGFLNHDALYSHLYERNVDRFDSLSEQEVEAALEREAESFREEAIEVYGRYPDPGVFYKEYLFRQPCGSWHWFEGLQDDTFLFDEDFENRTVDELFDALRKLRETPDQNPHNLWLQKIWTPRAQERIRIHLNDSIGELLREVKSEKKALDEIRPRQLEELIAELLRRRGMAIYVTPETRDGGRDIIARGEIIPGEPTTLAVEIKQKPVVGIADLRNALKANEDFPALMVATSGRFSAGVFEEKKRNRNQFRLFLKDGLALSQWLRQS